MTLVLVTGATGKTGRHLVQQLAARGLACRAASRGSEPPFDWARPEGWVAALDGVDAVYLVAPGTIADPYAPTMAFIRLAQDQGVRRFVFLGMASLPAGGPGHGQVHQFLIDRCDDWAVLRPGAFMQNFSEGPFAASIRQEDRIYSNTGDGRVALIDAADIAAAALAALTAPAALNADFTLTGGEALTYDEIAERIGRACGRAVTHVHLSTAAMAQRFVDRGLPEQTAQMLAGAYGRIADGGAARTTDDLRRLTGRPATTFDAFAATHAAMWGRAG